MKLFLAGMLAGGLGLMWLGNRALSEPGQSADVQIGGLVPFALGGLLVVLDIIIAFVWLVARA